MAESPRDWREALEWSQRQAVHRSQDWTGYCQKYVRSAYGIPALFGSALAQWYGADAEDRHPGGAPTDAPIGAALCFRSSPHGHIIYAARPFPSGTPGAWGTDMVRTGWGDKHPRTAPTTQWGQPYLGWLSAVNDYDLQLKEKKPPKPKQNKRYKAIARAIERMEDARTVARKQGDKKDAQAFTEEIRRLKRMYERMRRY